MVDPRGSQSRRGARGWARDTYDRLRAYLVVAVQAGLAAGLSWFIAHDLLHAKQALFAPAAAVGTIAASLGNRVRRTGELISGVILGVLVGQVIIDLIGVGPVQTGLVVALAISAAVAVHGSGAIITQAASTAVLLGTISPLHQHVAVPRTLNAMIGGLTAVTVTLLILPLNPLRVVHRAGGRNLDMLARELTAAAIAITERDDQQLEATLRRLHTVEQAERGGYDMLGAAQEVVRLSPWRRGRRSRIRRYQQAAQHLDSTYSSSRDAVRWALRALRGGESIPDALPASIDRLGQGARLLHRDFLTGRDPVHGLERVEQAIRDVDRADAEKCQFAIQVAIFQLRIALSALLQAAGLDRTEANRRLGLRNEM